MRAGELKQRIEIQTNTPTQDSEGELIDSWVATHSDVAAKVTSKAVEEADESGAVRSREGFVIVIRYQPGLTTDQRVVYLTMPLTIEAILHDRGQQKRMELICSQVAV
tara:strand:- start:293 stop:616 length:324 start_codon:yes stop_codon:yes gene_type:complete